MVPSCSFHQAQIPHQALRPSAGVSCAAASSRVPHLPRLSLCTSLGSFPQVPASARPAAPSHAATVQPFHLTCLNIYGTHMTSELQGPQV